MQNKLKLNLVHIQNELKLNLVDVDWLNSNNFSTLYGGKKIIFP